MKSPIKAVITTDTKTLKDGVIHLQASGDGLQELLNFIRLRKLKPGAVVQLQLKDKESKSARQNRTYRLLVQIAIQSGLFGMDYETLHKCFKQAYGVIDAYKDFDGKWQTSLKSTADYTMPEMAQLITGTIDFINVKFADHRYIDKRFDEMMQEFNSQKIEPPEELEIF